MYVLCLHLVSSSPKSNHVMEVKDECESFLQLYLYCYCQMHLSVSMSVLFWKMAVTMDLLWSDDKLFF